MKSLHVLIVLCVFTISAGAAPPGDDLRSGFLISRKKAAAARPQPKRARTASRAKAVAPAQTATAGALALGYSLYVRDRSGAPVRVDPSRALRDGDRVRLVLEPSEDGYLYVFNTDDRGAPPAMIFPDPRIASGANRVLAHVPYELPSPAAADSSLRWFHLEDGPATDFLYVVVSREPLTGVPTGAELAAWCEGRGDCLWSPGEASWAGVVAGLAAGAQLESVAQAFGAKQSAAEASAVLRSVRLRPEAPAPTVVRANVSSSAPMLVTRVEIRHDTRS